MKGTVHYEVRDDVALMTIDNPPVNPLSSGVRQGLNDGIAQALADDGVKAIVLTGAGRAFIAGADISEFGGESKGPGLADCLNAMDDSTKPIVAAINGTAFGGGLEVALCCHYRVIAPSAPVGRFQKAGSRMARNMASGGSAGAPFVPSVPVGSFPKWAPFYKTAN